MGFNLSHYDADGWREFVYCAMVYRENKNRKLFKLVCQLELPVALTSGALDNIKTHVEKY
jgi:hypothetical protein